MWTRENAFAFLEKLETRAATYGLHVALGGSVMYRGDSTKDLDVIVYRHKTSHPIAWGHLVTVLKQELGMKWFQPIDHAVYGDDKTVIVAYIERQRVDFICLF